MVLELVGNRLDISQNEDICVWGTERGTERETESGTERVGGREDRKQRETLKRVCEESQESV